MKREITLQNNRIEYDLSQRANSRSIRARVAFGKLKVTAPAYVTIREIEQFLIRNGDHILSNIEETSVADYRDGGFVYILGRKYQIVQIDMHIKKCVIKENKITVYGSNIQECIQEMLQRWLKGYIEKYIQEFVKKNSSFPMPEITYKRTSGRYGACYYMKNKVCFNPVLTHYTQDFIDSVIIHEMCHFKVHDHSPSFYRECEKYMPDYMRISGGKKTYD